MISLATADKKVWIKYRKIYMQWLKGQLSKEFQGFKATFLTQGNIKFTSKYIISGTQLCINKIASKPHNPLTSKIRL